MKRYYVIVTIRSNDPECCYDTFTTEYFENAVPWAQWCEKMQSLLNNDETCRTCTYWACMNRKELIGACTIWHDSGKTWPKSWESCPQWRQYKRKEEQHG